MKLVHIHMHFPWALLSLNLGQVFNPLNEFGVAKLCLLVTAPRQRQKGSSFINTKLNLASHISINRLENIFCMWWGRRKAERWRELDWKYFRDPGLVTFLHMKTQIFTHLTGHKHMYCHCHRSSRPKLSKTRLGFMPVLSDPQKWE